MKIEKKPLDIDFIKKWIAKGIDPIILSILNRRGLKEEEDLFDFLSPLIENIFSPFLFKDIITAFKRIDKAIKYREKVKKKNRNFLAKTLVENRTVTAQKTLEPKP